MHNKEISHLQKLLYSLIFGYTHQGKSCFYSNKALGEILGIDKRNIQMALSVLKNKGFITTLEFKGRRNIYIPSDPIISEEEEEDHPMTKSSPPHDEIITPPVTKSSPIIDKVINKDTKTIKCDSIARKSIFESFWSIYPSKKAKKKCQEIWNRKKLNSIADDIVEKLLKQIDGDEHFKQGFVPNPSTYLNQERWNDDLTPHRDNIQAVKKAEIREIADKRVAELERLSEKERENQVKKYMQFNQDGAAYRKIIKDISIPDGLKSLKSAVGLK